MTYFLGMLMIEWMQKHKKWLIVTIWIATIAFIGAGGFAWGVYDYSLSGDSVAKVGKITISKAEYMMRYQEEFDERNKRLGGDFDEAQAKNMGLDTYVLNGLISNALIRNYALDLGLRVSDEELAHEISSSKDFDFLKTDGVFDIAKYDAFIAAQGMKKQYFEERVRDSILTKKVVALLFPQIVRATPFPATGLERDSLNFGLSISDNIELGVIYGNSIPIQPNEKDLKKFWEGIKESYKTPASYKIQAVITKTKDQSYSDEELKKFYEQNYITQGNDLIPESIKTQVIEALQQQKAKIQALKIYTDLQKSRADSAEEFIISQDSTAYSSEILSALESSTPNAVLKPLAFGEDFITIKVIEKTAPQVQDFADVASLVKKEYIHQMRLQELENMAKSRLSTFAGERINNVRLPSQEEISLQTYKIGNLDFYTSMSLLQNIFDSPKSVNYAIIGENAFLFRILSQSATPFQGAVYIDAIINQTKMELMTRLVFEFLEQKYGVKKFI